TAKENLTQLVEYLEEKRKTAAENLEELQEKIDQHFKYDAVEEIIKSLESDSSDFAQKTKENMLSKSPVSLKVTLKQLKKGEGKSFGECLDNDLTIASNLIIHGDFYEGVRSVVVDRDRNPNYEYNQLSDVTDEWVHSFFATNESHS